MRILDFLDSWFFFFFCFVLFCVQWSGFIFSQFSVLPSLNCPPKKAFLWSVFLEGGQGLLADEWQQNGTGPDGCVLSTWSSRTDPFDLLFSHWMRQTPLETQRQVLEQTPAVEAMAFHMRALQTNFWNCFTSASMLFWNPFHLETAVSALSLQRWYLCVSSSSFLDPTTLLGKVSVQLRPANPGKTSSASEPGFVWHVHVPIAATWSKAN